VADLLNGQIDWDFIAVQQHPLELKLATKNALPPPVAREPATEATPPEPYRLVEPWSLQPTSPLEQTRILARAGLAAKDLGHAIAANLRRLNIQEER
jgi:hypothetical protein